MTLKLREYGNGPTVILLHGGPGAAGYLGPVARGLADAFRILEPMQRACGDKSLTVARHLEDLHALVDAHGDGKRPALVGHSWGAMLALAYAAAYPGSVASLALIGCGTFDAASRARFEANCNDRIRGDTRAQLAQLETEVPDPDARLFVLSELLLPAYSYDLASVNLPVEADAKAHRDTWANMLHLQDEGVYPAAFAAIDSPVLMLHGRDDPHPGPMIRASLAQQIPQLIYHELPRCGHYPWLERQARETFFAELRRWLGSTLAVPC